MVDRLKYWWGKIPRQVKALCYALAATIGATELMKFVVRDVVLATNNLVAVVLLFLLYIWYSKRNLKLGRREGVFVVVGTVILAGILTIGGQLEYYNEIFWRISTIVKVVLVGFLVYPVVWELIKAVSELKVGRMVWEQKYFWIAFAIIAISTFIVWRALWPGIYTYDMASQNEQISSGNITAHWSLLYGYLFAGFLDLGHLIFHNYEAGMAMAMIVQALFIIFVETKIIKFATERSKSLVVYLGGILLFSLVPFFTVISVSSAQDVLFAGLFALVVLELVGVVEDKKRIDKKYTVIKLLFLNVAMCMLRNNGVYALLVMFVFTAIFYKAPKKKLLYTIGGAIVLSFLYSGPMLSVLGVKKTTAVQEIAGVPSQQIARAYFAGKISDQEREEVQKFYDFSATDYDTEGDFAQYPKYPLIADYTKSTLRTEAVKDDLLQYIGLWMKLGLKNPDDYVEAFLLNSFGYWYPNKNYSDPRLSLDFMNYPGFAMTGAFYDSEHHPNMKPVVRADYDPEKAIELDDFVFGDKWMTIPIVSTICSIGTYMLLMWFVVGVVIMQKRYKLLVAMSLVVGLYLTLLLSPVAIFRYAYPIVILGPVFVGLLWRRDEDTNDSLSSAI